MTTLCRKRNSEWFAVPDNVELETLGRYYLSQDEGSDAPVLWTQVISFWRDGTFSYVVGTYAANKNTKEHNGSLITVQHTTVCPPHHIPGFECVNF